MNLGMLNPRNWGGAGAAKRLPGEALTVREAPAMGPYSSVLQFVAREVAPRLYEAMREACPVLDGAIGLQVTLDGIVRVRGENERLVTEIEDFIENVPVNDMQTGLQSFFNLMSNERYEQGFCLGETQLDKRGREVERLWVADSKGVHFKREAPAAPLEIWYAPPAPDRNTRRDGTEQIERVLRNSWVTSSGLVDYLNGNGYRKLQRDNLIYAALDAEADNPYGVSALRSTEFVTQALLTMTNSQKLVWDRFGNPVFEVIYKTKAKVDEAVLETRRTRFATMLSEAMNIKRKGNSADIVAAIGRDDELTFKVLGGDGQVLEVEHPARFVLEQVIAKLGLPPWMLGYIWGTAERLADRQVDLVLQKSRTRFAIWRPALSDVVATFLRARGRTWSSGDWELYQELPNLKDEQQQAVAKFQMAQAYQVLVDRGIDPAVIGLAGNNAPELANARPGVPAGAGAAAEGSRAAKHAALSHEHKDEAYVEDEAALMRLERTAERDLLARWGQLYDDTIDVLGLPGSATRGANGAGRKQEPVFLFDPAAMIQALRALEAEYVAAAGAEDAALAQSVYQAWLRGVENASSELEPTLAGAVDAIDATVRAQVARQLAEHGLEQVRETAIRAFGNDIIAALEQGQYDGLNPNDVARALRKQFDAGEYNWTRLARSEIAAAQGRGKMDEYAAMEITEYRWLPAGDACPICTSIAAGGPYTVGQGPTPMVSSHPNCRCSVAAVV